VAREANGAEFLIVRELGFEQRVAEHRVVDPRTNARDFARGVELTFEAVLAARDELDAADSGLALDARVVRDRGSSRIPGVSTRFPRDVLDGGGLRVGSAVAFAGAFQAVDRRRTGPPSAPRARGARDSAR
jgi:hypothetical protein